MNDRISENLKCPFYKKILRTSRFIGIECESLMHEEALGFATSHVTRFNNYHELKDYSELLCCENWTECPYYKALMRGRYAELPKGTEKK